MDIVKIGHFISESRKEKNLTQRQLADFLRVSDKTVSRWETGKGMPDPSSWLKLGDILGVSINELLTGEKNNTVPASDLPEINLIEASTYYEKKSRAWRKRSIVAAVCLLVILIFPGLFLVRQLWASEPSSTPEAAIMKYSILSGLRVDQDSFSMRENLEAYDSIHKTHRYFVSGVMSKQNGSVCFFTIEERNGGYLVVKAGTGP